MSGQRESLDPFPESRRDAARKALRTAFGSDAIDGALNEATLLTGGLSTALVYRVVVRERPYVLRMIQRVDAFHDPVRQFACMQMAADAGIAPAVRYADAADGVSITDFVDTSAAAGAQPDRGTRLRLLVETIRAIQQLPLFPPLVDYLDGVDGLIQHFHASETLPAAAAAEHFAAYAEIQRVYPRHDPGAVSSHNDLNPNNLLYDGRKLWVIDWEAAFRNDPYVDLANAANFFLAEDADEEEAYLAWHFGDALDDDRRARFFLMRQVCRMCYAMTFLALAGPSAAGPGAAAIDAGMETPPLADVHRQIAAGSLSLASAAGQRLYGKTLLNEMLRQMRTPRFTEAIRRMRSPAART